MATRFAVHRNGAGGIQPALMTGAGFTQAALTIGVVVQQRKIRTVPMTSDTIGKTPSMSTNAPHCYCIKKGAASINSRQLHLRLVQYFITYVEPSICICLFSIRIYAEWNSRRSFMSICRSRSPRTYHIQSSFYRRTIARHGTVWLNKAALYRLVDCFVHSSSSTAVTDPAETNRTTTVTLEARMIRQLCKINTGPNHAFH